jgi:hypothetical protein
MTMQDEYSAGTETRADHIRALVQQAVAETHRAAERARDEAAAQQAYNARKHAFNARAADFQTEKPDFDQVARNPNLQITQIMADAITDPDAGPQISYYLGQNPSEAARIASLSIGRQIAEIGKLEASVGSHARNTAAAPSPSRTISSASSASAEPDLGHPDMSNAEYRALRAEQKKRLMPLIARDKIRGVSTNDRPSQNALAP